MKAVQTALVAVSFAAQLASAHWNQNASPFNTPSNCNNTCSSQQQGGFNWNSHPAGNPSNIGDFSFHGCQVKSALGKRDHLGRRTNGNCLAGHADSKSGPGMGCSSHGFSVNEIHVSTENDKQPIECHYHMPDNSICKTHHTCGKDVQVIKNDQCGGATSMSVAIPTHAPKPSCTVSLHTVNFHCGTASYTPTVTPHSETKTSSSTHSTSKTESKTTNAYTKPTPESPKNATTSTSSTPSSSIPLSTAASYKPSAGPSVSIGYTSAIYKNQTTTSHSTFMHTTTTSCSSGQVITSTNSGHVYSTTLTAPSVITTAYQTSTPVSSPASPESTSAVSYGSASSSAGPSPVTSAAPYTTSTTCPPGYVVSGSGQPTTLTAPSVSSYVVTPSAGAPQQGTSPASPTQAPAPNVLPRCLNSFESKCKSNTDSDCYCKDSDFITQAIQCAAAHAESDDDAAQAIAYLQGICAPHIASNPAIVTACPSYITPPAPAATAAGPMTTVPYSSGSYSTTITAPQVSFATTGSAPGLYPASPATTSAPAAAAQPPYPTGSYSYGAPAGTAASTGFATSSYPSATGMPATYNPGNAAGKNVVSGLAAAAAGVAAVMLF